MLMKPDRLLLPRRAVIGESLTLVAFRELPLEFAGQKPGCTCKAAGEAQTAGRFSLNPRRECQSRRCRIRSSLGELVQSHHAPWLPG